MNINLGNNINSFTISMVLFAIIAIIVAIIIVVAKPKYSKKFTEEQRNNQCTGYKIGFFTMIGYFVINGLYCASYGNWFDVISMNAIGVFIGFVCFGTYAIFKNAFVSNDEKYSSRLWTMFILTLVFASIVFANKNDDGSLSEFSIALLIGVAGMGIICVELAVKMLIDKRKALKIAC